MHSFASSAKIRRSQANLRRLNVEVKHLRGNILSGILPMQRHRPPRAECASRSDGYCRIGRSLKKHCIAEHGCSDYIESATPAAPSRGDITKGISPNQNVSSVVIERAKHARPVAFDKSRRMLRSPADLLVPQRWASLEATAGTHRQINPADSGLGECSVSQRLS